jgi:hypothetical protein
MIISISQLRIRINLKNASGERDYLANSSRDNVPLNIADKCVVNYGNCKLQLEGIYPAAV